MKRHGVIVSPAGELGATFNPAVARTPPDGYIMLVRSIPKGYHKLGSVNEFDDRYTSHLSLWRGSAPDVFILENEHALMPSAPFDLFGVEDPRITKVGDTYYILYTALAIGLGQPDADRGIRIAMASTKDFKTFKKHGVIGPDRRSKAGTLFEAAGRLYFMWKDEQGVERTMLTPAPADFENAAAWQKLWKHQKSYRELMGPQKNAHESLGVEPGAPPIEIEEGLLVVYSSISADHKWTISVMLLDKNDPYNVLAKTAAPLLSPQEPYECKGDVNNVVFPCGAIVDQGRLYIYYGAADTVCALASEDMRTIRAVLKPLLKKPPGPVGAP